MVVFKIDVQAPRNENLGAVEMALKAGRMQRDDVELGRRRRRDAYLEEMVDDVFVSARRSEVL